MSVLHSGTFWHSTLSRIDAKPRNRVALTAPSHGEEKYESIVLMTAAHPVRGQNERFVIRKTLEFHSVLIAFGIVLRGQRFSRGQEIAKGANLKMCRRGNRFVLVGLICALSLLSSLPLPAQIASATLSGTVTDPTGKGVPNATVSIKKGPSGGPSQFQTDSAGHYQIPNLTPGEYDVSVSAAGFDTKQSTVTIAQGAQQTLDVNLTEALSLGNLGFSPSQTQANPQEQARLDKRSHMLQMHQRLGLITTAPLVATVILGTRAGGRSTSSTDRDVHAALGSVTAGLYFATAYYAIFAPKIPGTKTEGNIRLHKAMAWIHGPGMILTPILGEMAFSQKSHGERIHGIAQAHGAVAIVTAGAYGVAILSVSLKSGSVSHTAHHVAEVLGLEHSHSAETAADDVSSNP
jgi:hypothetical protein